MNIIKTILFIIVLTTTLTISIGCDNNPANSGTDSVSVIYLNYLNTGICIYVNDEFLMVKDALFSDKFRVRRGSALKARAYKNIYSTIPDTFNIVDVGQNATVYCNQSDCIATDDMYWKIGLR